VNHKLQLNIYAGLRRVKVLGVFDKKTEFNELLEGFHVNGMDAKTLLKQNDFVHTVKERKTA
jgi:hypothetical protein